MVGKAEGGAVDMREITDDRKYKWEVPEKCPLCNSEISYEIVDIFAVIKCSKCTWVEEACPK